MWDPQTAMQAVLVVGIGSLLLPPVARVAGGFCGVIGFFGVLQSRTWAPTVMALGLLAWFIGHWSFVVRHDVVYRTRLARLGTRLARLVIDKTPLKWTIPRYWRLLRQQRATAAR